MTGEFNIDKLKKKIKASQVPYWKEYFQRKAIDFSDTGLLLDMIGSASYEIACFRWYMTSMFSSGSPSPFPDHVNYIPSEYRESKKKRQKEQQSFKEKVSKMSPEEIKELKKKISQQKLANILPHLGTSGQKIAKKLEQKKKEVVSDGKTEHSKDSGSDSNS